jgi:hypothetical protein
MQRPQLEHLLRAACAITDETEFLIIGSQAILGAYPEAPEAVLESVEADLIPLNLPHKWNEIDGVLGEMSSFHETFGYYAQGVELGTAVLPKHWQQRLVLIENPNTRGAKGYCLEPHDLVLSKYVAGREKDRIFARACLKHGLIQVETLMARVGSLPVSAERLAVIQRQIAFDNAAQPPN